MLYTSLVRDAIFPHCTGTVAQETRDLKTVKKGRHYLPRQRLIIDVLRDTVANEEFQLSVLKTERLACED